MFLLRKEILMRFVREKDIIRHSDEFEHYGVQGMKWGVRRATYKKRSQKALKKSRAKVQKDIVDTKQKSAKYAEKSAKYNYDAYKNLAKNKVNSYRKLKVKSSKYDLKAKKGEKLITKNNRLLSLYDKRIDELMNKKK